jgi:hypothetical protein
MTMTVGTEGEDKNQLKAAVKDGDGNGDWDKSQLKVA